MSQMRHAWRPHAPNYGHTTDAPSGDCAEVRPYQVEFYMILFPVVLGSLVGLFILESVRELRTESTARRLDDVDDMENAA